MEIVCALHDCVQEARVLNLRVLRLQSESLCKSVCVHFLAIIMHEKSSESESDNVFMALLQSLQRSCCGGSQVCGTTTCPNLAKNEGTSGFMER